MAAEYGKPGVHKSNTFVFVAFYALTALAGDARAKTTVQVLETYPAGDVITLGKNQSFYLRIGYSTDKPVRIWARPFFQGSEVAAGSNPSRVYSGSDEALGWFFFMEPGKQVDEDRIRAGTVRGTARASWPLTQCGLPVAISRLQGRNRPGWSSSETRINACSRKHSSSG